MIFIYVRYYGDQFFFYLKNTRKIDRFGWKLFKLNAPDAIWWQNKNECFSSTQYISIVLSFGAYGSFFDKPLSL